MTNIFESKHYTAWMYLLISITLIAVLFNIVNITDNIHINKTFNESKLTANAVSENIKNMNIAKINNTNISSAKNQEIYSQKTYGIYYIILILVGILVFTILVTFIFPRIKHLT